MTTDLRGPIQEFVSRLQHGTRYWLAKTNDIALHIGKAAAYGAKRLVVFFYGSDSDRYLQLNATTDEFGFSGPIRPKGFNKLPLRIEARWQPGWKGKPGFAADIQTSVTTMNATDPTFEVLGTNATSALSTLSASGGSLQTTAGADGDSQIILPHLQNTASINLWNSLTWPTDNLVTWECDVVTGASVTNYILWAGLKLTNTDVIATDDDSCFFRVQDGVNGGKFVCNYSIGGVDVSADSGIAVAVSTRYHLKVGITAARVPMFWIGVAGAADTLVVTGTALTTAVNLIPYLGVKASGAAAAKTARWLGQAISRTAA